MATKEEYAQLSLYVYDIKRDAHRDNRPLLLTGWEELDYKPDGGLGFSYGVFRRIGTTEVVVAYAGTNSGIDWVANVKNGIGLSSTQTTEAALAYLTAKQQYGSNITLTGHSLGGGLASIMAVWFDRPAVVFDEAPFEMTARNLWTILATKSALNLAGYSDSAFNGYDVLANYTAREAKVTNYYLEGEALAALRVAFPTVMGQDNLIRANGADMTGVGGAIDLHSQALLTSMLMSDSFRQSTYASTRVIPLLMDKNFYAYDAATSDQQNVLINFIRSEQGAGDKLTHFAADLNKLGTNIQGLNKAAQDALIAQGIEWYYWQGTDYAGQEFFTQTGESLQYTTAQGDGLANAQNKAASYIGKWLTPIVNNHGEFYSAGFATYDQWNVATSSSGATATALNAGKSQIYIGNSGADTFTGGDLGDVMFAGAGADTLDGAGGDDKLYGGAGDDTFKGGAGSDKLYGGDGSDTYIVGDGKDTLIDTVDGQGKLQLEGGVDLVGGKAAGQRNTWIGQNAETYSFIQTQAAQIGTLTISNLSTGGQVKIEKFDLAQAQADGYLGIKLDTTPKLIVAVNSEPTIATGTPFDAYDFDPNAFGSGSVTTVAEGSGRGFTVYLSQGAKAGDTLTLKLTGLAGKGLKAVLGNTTVDADGAVITLNEGQTQASFALIQEGATLDADTPGSISLAYQGAEQSATSNAWGVNLKDTGELARTYNGDQRAKLIGIEINLEVTPDKPSYNTYNWGATTWATDGTLTGGLAELDFADVIYAASTNDKMNGAGGNDALSGGAGNDTLDGGDGDDLIAGGTGSDIIQGGAGNDYISSSASMVAPWRRKPDDKWSPPGGGATVLASSATWGVYIASSGDSTIWDGIGSTNTASREGDTIDAGAGDDWVMASWGGDRVQGGDGKDQLDGLAGDDVLEGGAGNDIIDADGITKVGYLNTVAAPYHGADFADGGEGADNINGGGKADTLYGGAGDDDIAGDYWGRTDGQFYVSLGVHGADYLDGEDGDDYLEGGGKEDTLYGGAGADIMWGDTSVNNLVNASDNDLMWANDYLDGEEDDDQLIGGGKDDVLYGGIGNDMLWGDESDAALKAQYHGLDYLDGEDGDDYLEGGGNDDTLFGGAGADIMWGDTSVALLAGEFHGDDYLDGEDGDDQIVGNGGADTLFGGLGADLLLGDDNDLALGDHGADTLDGEEGDDQLYGHGGADLLFGGAGADWMFGGQDADQLIGGTGADMMQGDSGTQVNDGGDYLDGQDGDDLMFGEGGSDELHGGDGADRIAGDNGGYDSSGAADTIYGGAGNDFIDGQGGDDFIDAGADNDLVAGGAGNDLIFGGTGNDQLQGGEGNDTLAGGEGSDVLFGQAGNDTLQGSAERDYLIGGLGDDSLDGGEGDDIYYYATGEGNDRISDSGGTDWLVFNDINWGQVQLGVGSLKLTVPGGEIHLDDFDPDNPYAAGGIEYFQFADGTVMSKAQLINAIGFTPTGTPEADVLSGTALADTIRALAGDDVVTARGGNDIVYGGAGNDVLLGEAGDDTLYGEAGNDLLAGGAGTDLLMGGDGDDSYLFQTGDGQDTVTDALGQNAIALGAGLTLDAITFGRQGNDLFVAIKNTTDRLTVKDWFAVDSHFSSVLLGDGSVLDRAGVDAAMPTNQAPLATADSVTVVEDSLVTASGNALANDSDPEGRALRVTNPGSYAGTVGTLMLNGNGSYSYSLANESAAVQSLAAGQSLTERFAYGVTDDDPNGAVSSESAIVVTVLGSNDLPVPGFDSASTAEDASPVSGNVLANDYDIDTGTTLTVANAGTRTGSYGALELGSDGAWRYSLANSSSAVQSLAAGQTVSERFAFNVSDGITQVGGALSIAIAGQNDAPILVTALADQTAAANTNWNWQLPAGSFTDVDAGDVLRYGATLADGTVLPSWLSFDAATQTFSGRVPKSATGSIDLRVGASDRLGANVADVFTLNFAAGTGGGGGGNNGGGSTGNEGVGNGVDGPPPGHDTSFNDGTGTSPGNPGAQGGNGYRPPRREDIVTTQIQIASAMVDAPVLMALHGNSANARATAPGQVKAVAVDKLADMGAATPPTDNSQAFNANSRNDALSGNPGDMGAATAPADISQGFSVSARNDTAAAMSQTDAARQTAAAPTAWLTSAAWASLGDQGAVGNEGNGVAVFARWLAVEQALARQSANAGMLPAWLDSARGADLRGMFVGNGGLPDAYQSLGADTLGLRVGAGLQVFKGLGNGVQQIM